MLLLVSIALNYYPSGYLLSPQTLSHFLFPSRLITSTRKFCSVFSPNQDPNELSRRALHSTIFATIGAIGFMASALLPAHAYSARYGSLIVAASGAFSCIPPLLGWLSCNVFSTGAVGLAIALNISFGAPGQITGVWIYKADEAKKGYPTGHWVNAGLLFFVAAGSLCLLMYYRMLNARTRRAGEGEGSVRLYKC